MGAGRTPARGRCRRRDPGADGDRRPGNADRRGCGSRQPRRRRAGPPNLRRHRLRPSRLGSVHPARPGWHRRLFLCRSVFARFSHLAQRRSSSARCGLRRVARRRQNHRRLLSLRRDLGPRTDPSGLRRCSDRLAPRRAQMRRHGLFAAVRPVGLPRHPNRLCRRNRSQDPPPQTHRDHGFGWLQPPLSDRWSGDRHHPALLAPRRPARLHELRWPTPAGVCARYRQRSRAIARPRRGDDLRTAFFARWPSDRLFDGQRRQYRHFCRRCRWRHSAAADDHPRRRYFAELLARWWPHHLRKRSFGQPAALRHGFRRQRAKADQLRRRALRLAGVESARRPHRFYPHRRRGFPYRTDVLVGLGRAHADRQLAG